MAGCALANMGLEKIQDMTQKGRMSVRGSGKKQWMDLKLHLMLVQQAMDIMS